LDEKARYPDTAKSSEEGEGAVAGADEGEEDRFINSLTF